jgi:hypothetical protein
MKTTLLTETKTQLCIFIKCHYEKLEKINKAILEGGVLKFPDSLLSRDSVEKVAER